jgi:hypothetical protein
MPVARQPTALFVTVWESVPKISAPGTAYPFSGKMT